MYLNFWIYKSKLSLKGTAPIYLRITINGNKAEIATGVVIPPNNWNNKKGIVKGNSNEAKALNQKLKQLKEKILEIYNDFVTTGTPISPDIIKFTLMGGNDNQITLMYAFTYHHDLLNKKTKNSALVTKYNTLQNKIVRFLKHEYKREDLFLKELNHQFVVKFELYMKSEEQIGHNTTIKYIQFLKKIIHMSVAHGWLSQNPFANFKCSLLTVDRGYLSLTEINILKHKEFGTPRLEDVKNIFLFCCYTGLAYIGCIVWNNQGWDFNRNPLNINGTGVRNQYVDFRNPNDLLTLDAIRVRARWYDYASWLSFPNGVLAVGFINAGQYNR